MRSLNHTIRKFNRFELKYLAPLRAAESFKTALGAYMLPDDHGDAAGMYELTSLYYDGPDYPFYWEKIDGIRYRRKLRIRHYDTGAALTADTPVFVEIKQRLDRVTQKRRIRLPYCDALRLCSERQAPQCEPAGDEVVDEVLGLLWQYNLRPASAVRYTRLALMGAEHDLGLRVTFDTRLTYQSGCPALHEIRGGEALFPPQWTVIEIKANERIPFWLAELVAGHNLSLMRVSKYCRSIELSQHFQTPAPAWLAA